MRLSAQADPVQHPTLLVSSSRYAGNVSSVVPGVTVTGGVTASYDGSLPNVFLNEIADPSFGITSGITLDAYDIGNPSPQAHPLVGTPRLVGSLDVTAAAMAQGKSISTSFPSKSELALHISTDGTSVSLMGYAARCTDQSAGRFQLEHAQRDRSQQSGDIDDATRHRRRRPGRGCADALLRQRV